MKIYLVGGAVRDKLLGLPIKERDYVVVGATVQDMLKLGFRKVGKDFPVFLHPKTNEEYALARMERKVKPGYQGFVFDTSPDVSLADDLIRRDLTINAMAESESGELVDPYLGSKDIQKKLLRHVSTAFAEDPVRILRVGRFLARFGPLGFKVAPETISLMKQMVQSGEVNALVAERVWKELARALGEPQPENFFELLSACDALSILFPGLKLNSPGFAALKKAANLNFSPNVRLAALLHTENSEQIKILMRKYRIPKAYRELALITAQHYEAALQAKKFNATELVDFLRKLDAYRRLLRYEDFLKTTIAIAQSKNIAFDPVWLEQVLKIAKHADVQGLIKQGLDHEALAAGIRAKRIELVQKWLESK